MLYFTLHPLVQVVSSRSTFASLPIRTGRKEQLQRHIAIVAETNARNFARGKLGISQSNESSDRYSSSSTTSNTAQLRAMSENAFCPPFYLASLSCCKKSSCAFFWQITQNLALGLCGQEFYFSKQNLLLARGTVSNLSAVKSRRNDLLKHFLEIVSSSACCTGQCLSFWLLG